MHRQAKMIYTNQHDIGKWPCWQLFIHVERGREWNLVFHMCLWSFHFSIWCKLCFSCASIEACSSYESVAQSWRKIGDFLPKYEIHFYSQCSIFRDICDSLNGKCLFFRFDSFAFAFYSYVIFCERVCFSFSLYFVGLLTDNCMDSTHVNNILHKDS